MFVKGSPHEGLSGQSERARMTSDLVGTRKRKGRVVVGLWSVLTLRNSIDEGCGRP